MLLKVSVWIEKLSNSLKVKFSLTREFHQKELKVYLTNLLVYEYVLISICNKTYL